MNRTGIEKSISHIMVEIIEYIPNSVVSKTIIRKTTGNVTVVASDTDEDIAEKISPFDTFIQVIEGMAEIIIEGHVNILQVGQGIIIPAHTSQAIRGNDRFKLIATVIKSGYDGNNP
jgi:quercetin dioxygenase-like cupin family protein